MNPEAIHNLLLEVGLPVEVGRWPPLRLSTGQQRLVAIACALASEAPFVILDEPMAGLDAKGRQLVKQALAQLHDTRELGWIIVSHHPDDLLGLVERIWVLENGELLYDGPFQRVPLNVLNVCLSTNNRSFYYWMRKLDSHGKTFPEVAYSAVQPEEVADFISAGGIL
jgi:energy-coupling factor transport system ATP-binding protein